MPRVLIEVDKIDLLWILAVPEKDVFEITAVRITQTFCLPKIVTMALLCRLYQCYWMVMTDKISPGTGDYS